MHRANADDTAAEFAGSNDGVEEAMLAEALRRSMVDAAAQEFEDEADAGDRGERSGRGLAAAQAAYEAAYELVKRLILDDHFMVPLLEATGVGALRNYHKQQNGDRIGNQRHHKQQSGAKK